MRWKYVVLAAVLGLMGMTTARAASQTINFDALPANSALNGQYPSSTVDWGTNLWYVSGPWGAFAGNSISFANSSQTSATFSPLRQQTPLSVDAFNGGTTSTTLTFSCAGQTTKQVSLGANQLTTVQFGWTAACTTVTIASSNGWNTNFNNFVLNNPPGPLISAVQASAITYNSATITWTTDVASTSQVDYGTTSAYGSSSSLNSTMLTSHSASLSGLSAATTYHYRVKSQDSSGNLSTTGDYTFTTTSAACVPPVTNPVACENLSPGTPSSQWYVSGNGSSSVQGFATDISVNKGSTINFKVSTPSKAYHLDIYRMGYYGGNGARLVATIQPSANLPQSQPACRVDSTTLLTDCGNWAVSASWAVPTTAVSGIYFANVVRTDASGTSQIWFVVRDDASNSPILFQTADTTWQAYNDYGGGSLYGGTPGNRVSYNRPFTNPVVKPESWVFNDEYPMVRFLEANGYNVSYATGVDTDRRGAAALQTHQVFLSVAHDEYWSGNQRANVEAARAAGLNLAFFSGNESFWKTRWENSYDGTSTPYRTLVTYKETTANQVTDPADPPTWTGTWRDPRWSPPADGGRPENALSGNIFMVNAGSDQSMVVPAAQGKMRFWRNTFIASLGAGQSATLTAGCGCLLGYEWDEDLDNGARPAGIVRLSHTTASVSSLLLDYGSTYGNGTATHNLTLYRYKGGALVFGAGTVNWARGLDDGGNLLSPNYGSSPEPAIQQATVNLLADMGVQPYSLLPTLVPAAASTDTTPPTSQISSPVSGANLQANKQVTISGTASDAGGGQVGGIEVSVDGGTTWHPATGLSSWTYTWTPSVNGLNTIRSRAVDDSGNLETPGAGITVNVTGGVNPTNTPTVTPTAGPPTATPTPIPPCSTCVTLWPNTATPAIIDQNDTSAVEVGVKFTADVAGNINGIRFYKGPTNTGTHVASLWTNAGTLLARATFAAETASGWQQVNFASPVAITANTTYVASYHTNVGQYSQTDSYFTSSGQNTPPLHAPMSSSAGGNGVYTYGATSIFPTSTFSDANYWVDVVFNPSGATATSTPTPTPTPGSSLPTATPTVTPTATPGPCATCVSLWPAATTPGIADQSDNSAVELGVKFTSDSAGSIVGIRFYKGPTNTGTHVASLWTSSGALLARATFASETASGWQQVNFATPVAISASTTYVASYHTNVGQYALNQNYFTSTGQNTPPLHAPMSSSVGGNGVYAYAATSTFPNNSFADSNYWVDVVFK